MKRVVGPVRALEHSQMVASHPGRPALGIRALAGLGVLGGAVGLAVFVGFPDELNLGRLVLWYVGAIGVALAAFGPQAAVSRPLALAATIPLVAVSAWAILWLVIGTGVPSPSSGTFGLLGFAAGLGGWLAAALFGLIAVRLGVLWRWPSVALALGALMAMTGIDRLALTSGDSPTIFASISLAGFVLVGSAWILLGSQVATGRAQPRVATTDIPLQAVEA